MATDERVARKRRKEERDRNEKMVKLWAHRIWRAINWLIITFLAYGAFSEVLRLLQASRTGRIKFIFFVAMVGISAIMVVFAEGTSHDHFRRKTGQIIAIVSETIMILPIVFDTILLLGMDLCNAVTENIGGKIFNVDNYKNSDAGWWGISLIATVVVCVSLLREEQSTDKYLGFARTPQKRDITDISDAKDEDGNPVLRISKYKK